MGYMACNRRYGHRNGDRHISARCGSGVRVAQTDVMSGGTRSNILNKEQLTTSTIRVSKRGCSGKRLSGVYAGRNAGPITLKIDQHELSGNSGSNASDSRDVKDVLGIRADVSTVANSKDLSAVPGSFVAAFPSQSGSSECVCDWGSG